MDLTEKDKKWRGFNQSLIREAQKMNWGLYRNIRFEMAEFLKREGKLQNSLETYLEVLYLDQNGPENRESIKDNPDLLREFPMFDSNTAFIAPGIVDQVRIFAKKLEMTLVEIKQIFIPHNQRIRQALKTPITAEMAWANIESKLSKIISK